MSEGAVRAAAAVIVCAALPARKALVRICGCLQFVERGVRLLLSLKPYKCALVHLWATVPSRLNSRCVVGSWR